MSEARISPEAAELVRQICGTDLNGGFIRDLCFTVWSICHNPTHEDGNADWGNDTLPTVQTGVAKVRNMLHAALTSPPKAGAGEPVLLREAAELADEIWASLDEVRRETNLTDSWYSVAEIEGQRIIDFARRIATSEPRGDVREEDGGLDAGINYAIRQLCEILDVDPHSISWDAATETMARRINRRPHLALAICRSAGLA